MSDKLSDSVTKAWIRLVRARHAVVSAVEADSKAAGTLPVEWYDVLWDLERHEGGVRPGLRRGGRGRGRAAEDSVERASPQGPMP